MVPGACAAPRNTALKASRSEARCGRASAGARSEGSDSQEPWASISTRARNATVPPSARTSQRQSPGPPVTARSAAGCSTVAPAAAARSISSASRLSRPRARPQAQRGWSAGGRGAMTDASPRISVTLRSSAPARASKASPTPSACNSGRLLAARHSPHTLRRGKRFFSVSATRQPARASRMAAVEPARPAPTITASCPPTGAPVTSAAAGARRPGGRKGRRGARARPSHGRDRARRRRSRRP